MGMTVAVGAGSAPRWMSWAHAARAVVSMSHVLSFSFWGYGGEGDRPPRLELKLINIMLTNTVSLSITQWPASSKAAAGS